MFEGRARPGRRRLPDAARAAGHPGGQLAVDLLRAVDEAGQELLLQRPHGHPRRCALALIAATTLCEPSRIGTAIERTPASSSWSTAAQPWQRTAASTARSSSGSVIVCSVSWRSSVRPRCASSSASGRWASRTRPMEVGYGGSRVPTVSEIVMIRLAEARAT